MAAPQDPLLAAAEELEALALDHQMDAAFAAAGLAAKEWELPHAAGSTSGEPHPDTVPVGTTMPLGDTATGEPDVAPAPEPFPMPPPNPDPIPMPGPVDGLDLARYEQLFDLQSKQLDKVTAMNQESLDRLMGMMERLGFTEAYRSQITNFSAVLAKVLGVPQEAASTGDPQEPEVPTPASQ